MVTNNAAVYNSVTYTTRTIDKNKYSLYTSDVNILTIDLSCNSWQTLFHQSWGPKMQPFLLEQPYQI